jgi:hypothetical protein
MKLIFKKAGLIFFIILIFNIVHSQSLMLSFGPTFTTTKQIVPIINGGKGDANTDYLFSVSYEHFFTKKPISVLASLTKFDGYTFMFFEPGGFVYYGNEIGGTGFSGVKINRIDLGVAYRLTDPKKKFYFSPFIVAGLQVSKKTGAEIYSELIPIKGPNYFELEPISADPRNTTQIVPSLGFRTGLVFWKRLDVNLCVQGVYGFIPYQKMYFKYEYKGVPQTTGEFESTGTGLFISLGIGYRFARLIKSNK